MSLSSVLRRGVALAALLVAAPLALSACSPANDAPSTGGWTYTDDLGRTVTLDEAPKAVAGFVDQVVPLMNYGIEPVALFGRRDLATDERLTGLDLTKVANVGITYGEIDLEALAAAAPDLIVVSVYPTDAAGTISPDKPYYGVKDLEQQAQLERIAPIVVIKVAGSGKELLASQERLATSIGADQAKIDAGRGEFDRASARLKEVATRTGITVTSLFADADGLYLTKPAHDPQTQLYQELGLQFTSVREDDEYYWDTYSWENAGQAAMGDLLLVSPEGFRKDDLLAQPTFASTPALQAGQVQDWSYGAMDYASQAKYLNRISDWMEQAKRVTS